MKKLILTGFVGSDPKKVTIPNDKFFVSINLAVQSGTRAKPITEWVDVSCYDRYADLALDYIKKGTKILVESNYFDVKSYIKKDGTPVATLKVKADYIEFLTSKSQAEDKTTFSETSPLTNDDVPF